jgi:hypothetical protein
METRHVLFVALHRLLIIPQAAVDKPQVVLRCDCEANLPEGGGNRQGTLTGRECLVRFADLRKMGE